MAEAEPGAVAVTGAQHPAGLRRFAAHADQPWTDSSGPGGVIGLCGCDLAPPYRPPHYVLPGELSGLSSVQGRPSARHTPRGPWWERFDAPLLNQLEQHLTAENPDLAAMAEEYTQARDLAAEARAGLFPQVTANGLLSDNKESPHRLFRNPNSAAPLVEAE